MKSVVAQIPDTAMNNLKENLRAAILKLSPVDQSILAFFIDDPRTFVDKSVRVLNITPNVVSVRKNRALAKLPDLMGVSREEYFGLYEERTFAGFLQKRVPASIPRTSYTNPVFPQFDLDGTVLRLYDTICETASTK